MQEAQTGFEPVNQGVADPRLTTWLLRHDDTVSYKIVNVLAQVLVVLQTCRKSLEPTKTLGIWEGFHLISTLFLSLF